MMRTSIQPKRQRSITIWGMNSKKKSIHDRLYALFKPLLTMPNVMCATPKITDSFIFKELLNMISWLDRYQTGSIPAG